jgi:sec-independent protein translocase protein TatB
MFGMGMGELVVILIVALLVLGPDKIPDAAKAIGKGMRELRKQTRVVQETLEQDEQLGSTVRDLKSMLRGEDPRPIIKPPVHAPVGRAPITAAASTPEASPAPDAPPALAAPAVAEATVTPPAKPGSDSGNV